MEECPWGPLWFLGWTSGRKWGRRGVMREKTETEKAKKEEGYAGVAIRLCEVRYTPPS